jgi:DNA (cytosine-5)-methyltransferase 1
MTQTKTDSGVGPIASEGMAQPPARLDRYTSGEGYVTHELKIGALHVVATMWTTAGSDDLKGAWWRGYLEGKQPEAIDPIGGRLRTADLFCGSGGLANGVRQLCAELGISVVSQFIADQDEQATHVYTANHSSRRRTNASVTKLIDYSVKHGSSGATFTYRPEFVDFDLVQAVGSIDVVLAGPPCQGHSNLNNQTRRADPRNDLYLTVPAFAVAVGAPMCILENVTSILNDSSGVVETARQLFVSEGYDVTMGQLSASEIGWPQARRRHFLIARRDRPPVPLGEIESLLRDQPRPLWWAIHDLEDEVGKDVMSQVSKLSVENMSRIDWLFDNDQDELDLLERPECHREGTTYTAVYGRLKKDQPAPTITTGFTSPGRGRFTHPTRRRVLTPREAARLQGFPDTYCFSPDPLNPPGRAQLAKWIGDAVPMPLAYAAALSALGEGIPGV